jgi:hypothetical protein
MNQNQIPETQQQPKKADGRSRSSGANLAKAREKRLAELRQQKELKEKVPTTVPLPSHVEDDSSSSSSSSEEEEILYVQPRVPKKKTPEQEELKQKLDFLIANLRNKPKKPKKEKIVYVPQPTPVTQPVPISQPVQTNPVKDDISQHLKHKILNF